MIKANAFLLNKGNKQRSIFEGGNKCYGSTNNGAFIVSLGLMVGRSIHYGGDYHIVTS